MRLDKSIFLAFIITLLSYSAGAQNKFADYKWGAVPKRDSIPAAWTKYDAVIMNKEETFSIGQIPTVVKDTRVRILKKESIKENSRIYIPKSNIIIKTLDARIIKPDGKMVDLIAKDIKKLTATDDEDLANLDNTSVFEIPGIEIGDEVETFMELDYAYSSSLIFLYDEVPVMKSTFNLIMPNEYTREVKVYNNMPKPAMVNNPNTTIYTWTMTNLPPILGLQHAIPTIELPYSSYSITGSNLTNGDILAHTPSWRWDNALEQLGQIEKSGKLLGGKDTFTVDGFIKEQCKGLSPKDYLGRMTRLHNYINDRVRVVPSEKANSSAPKAYLDFYMRKGEMPQLKIYTLYKNLLEAQSIPYYILLARNRYAGPFDLTLVSPEQISDLLIAFDDSAGNTHFIHPKDKVEKFEMDEVPVGLQNTDAILIRSSDRSTGKMLIPDVPENLNVTSTKGKVNIDLKEGKAKAEVTETITGNASTIGRNGILYSNEKHKLKDIYRRALKKKDIILDTVYIASQSHEYPYNFKTAYNARIEKGITKVEEGVYSIAIDKWPWNDEEEMKEGEYILDYYPYYPGTDRIQYFLRFENDVELVNGKDLAISKSFKNIGSYKFSVSQPDSKTIMLESLYLIDAKKISKSDMKDMLALNKSMFKANKEPIMVKLKK